MNTHWGTLYYDGSCRFCTDGVASLRGWLARRGVGVAPFEVGDGEPVPDEMRLRCRDGREFGGADAALVVIGAKWWGKPLAWMGRLPGVHGLLVAGYRAVAKRRHCMNGACRISLPVEVEGKVDIANRTTLAVGPEARLYPGPVDDQLPLDDEVGRGLRARRERGKAINLPAAWALTGLLTLVAWAGGVVLELEGWLRMWLLAAAMWVGFKVLALATTAVAGWPRGIAGWLGYALWPGMDAAAFADRGRPKIYGEAGWKLALVAAARMGLGALLIFWLAAKCASPVAAGWCGMVGLVLLLHFGAFDWLALFWRRVGFDVERLMDAPWRARSLADFWGARWNRAFSQVANRALFRPMTRRFGLAWGTLAGFALSGVAHELVISVPAGAGYGLPTAYFVLQGAGVLAERKLGWRGTRRGRVLMVVTLFGPVFWLFHAPFMTDVMGGLLG